MPQGSRPVAVAVAWAAAAVASLCVGGLIAIDTIRTVVSLHSSVPWFDDWDTVSLFRDWSRGRLSTLEALSSQFGEHRLLVPRLAFFADDLFLHGQGWLPLGGILLVQAAHAAAFASTLAATPSRDGSRWAVLGVVVALMFSLRQAANFQSSFQLQFVGVFAAATLAFVLFGRAAARAEAGLPAGATLAASLIAAAVSTFCMANGLICGLVLVVLGLAARLRAGIVAICALVWLALAILYVQGYHSPSDHTPLADALRRPPALALYAAGYLGNLAGVADPSGAVVLGFVGVLATAAAAMLVMRRSVEPRAGLALLGVMLFCGATALVTAVGRVDFGVAQALEQRYVTGSVTFWSAQLCFWWIAVPAPWPRAAMAVLCVWLAAVLVEAQPAEKTSLYVQKFDQDDAADLLLLGLRDPAVIRRIAWSDDNVQDLAPFMRDAAISVFGGPDAGLPGHPLADRERIAPPETCSGGVTTAVSDPRLGRDGVRIDGRARTVAGRGRLRRVLIVDAAGTVVGLAVTGRPGSQPDAWQGFAVAPPGSVLTAFGVLDAGRVCRLGEPRAVVRG